MFRTFYRRDFLKVVKKIQESGLPENLASMAQSRFDSHGERLVFHLKIGAKYGTI